MPTPSSSTCAASASRTNVTGVPTARRASTSPYPHVKQAGGALSIQSIRGFNDLLPAVTPSWQQVEAAARDVFAAYGYSEIRLPIVEATALFARSIGEVTDIVEKEMYSFDDRNGESLTLRPEGTAGSSGERRGGTGGRARR